MAEFLVETYAADAGRAALERARAAARQLTREGHPVRLVYSIHVPDEETRFYVFEASSVGDVRETARRASLSFDRVTEVVSESWGEAA